MRIADCSGPESAIRSPQPPFRIFRAFRVLRKSPLEVKLVVADPLVRVGHP